MIWTRHDRRQMARTASNVGQVVSRFEVGEWSDTGCGESGPCLSQDSPGLTDWIEVIVSIGDPKGMAADLAAYAEMARHYERGFGDAGGPLFED